MTNTVAIRKVGRPRKNINMEKVDKNLQTQITSGATPETIKLPDVSTLITDSEEDALLETTTVKQDDDETTIIEKIDEQPIKGELEDLIDEIIKDIDTKKAKKIAWWASLPHKEQFRAGDIVYDTSIDHFDVFVEPAKKEGLIKLRLFKVGSKKDVYTRDWYLEFDNIQLVKRGSHLKRGFTENDNTFVLKHKVYKTKEQDVVNV